MNTPIFDALFDSQPQDRRAVVQRALIESAARDAAWDRFNAELEEA